MSPHRWPYQLELVGHVTASYNAGCGLIAINWPRTKELTCNSSKISALA